MSGSQSFAGTPRIVVLDGATLNPGDNPWDDMARLGELTVYERSRPRDVIERSREADILVINKVRMTEEVFGQLPALRLVTVSATGYDCVDVRAAREAGVTVTNVPEYGTDSVAQHTFALLLHFCHHVELHDRAVRSGKWQQRGDFSFWEKPLIALAGKTMGIVGWGRIGHQVGDIAHAFGMFVRAYSRTRHEEPSFSQFAWADSMRELVAESDVVSLHCPSTDATRGMIDAALLAHFRPSAILINTARGALIVEQDLADALRDGVLRGAAVDVVSEEPIRDDNPLFSAPNCVITPHQAWATLLARQRLMRATVRNVQQFLAGVPENVV